jgi:hypothetical protein
MKPHMFLAMPSTSFPNLFKKSIGPTLELNQLQQYRLKQKFSKHGYQTTVKIFVDSSLLV